MISRPYCLPLVACIVLAGGLVEIHTLRSEVTKSDAKQQSAVANADREQEYTDLLYFSRSLQDENTWLRSYNASLRDQLWAAEHPGEKQEYIITVDPLGGPAGFVKPQDADGFIRP